MSRGSVAVAAIETRYAGYKFRSRLEARWAVLFDLLGIDWLYENEGYNVCGECYLPDFELTQYNAFFEVKGPQPYSHEVLHNLSVETERPVYMAFNEIPDVRTQYKYLKRVTKHGHTGCCFAHDRFGNIHVTETPLSSLLDESSAVCFDVAREEDFKIPAHAARRNNAIAKLHKSAQVGLFAPNWHQREKHLKRLSKGRGQH